MNLSWLVSIEHPDIRTVFEHSNNAPTLGMVFKYSNGVRVVSRQCCLGCRRSSSLRGAAPVQIQNFKDSNVKCLKLKTSESVKKSAARNQVTWN
jgi:hypothetical protein